MKKQKGITLIALIITIVVLLILSAVTISLTLGERGIFNTAIKAGQNYKEASDKEIAELENLEKEMQNAINGTGNDGTTKPEPQQVKLNTLTAEHYGDYVKYPIASIGRGPIGIEETHKSDWRIFYNDGSYVYLIASYLLLNSQAPTETGMSGYEGKPYTTYWPGGSPAYTTITENVRNNYKMSWNKNTTNDNLKCVSTLLDVSKWTKFVNNQYAIDAIGAPTLEMWVESWNEVSGRKIYCNNSNENGYYIGITSVPTTQSCAMDNSNNLYFPVSKSNISASNGETYWLASPSAHKNSCLFTVDANESSIRSWYFYSFAISLRPIVRLKADVMAKQDTDGVWELQ